MIQINDVYKLKKDVEQLKNAAPPEIDLSSYYTKDEINDINEKFITGNDLLRTNYNFVSSESSKIIDTAACNVYNYTIKGKTVNNESVGESEGNKILISTKTAYIYDYEKILEYVKTQMIPNSYPRLETDSNNDGKFFIYYRGDGVSIDLVPADFLKENTRYKIIASGFGPFASSNFNVVFTDGTSYSVPLNTVKDIDYISPSNKTISKIYVRLCATGSYMSGFYLANFKCFEYVEDNVPIEIQLDAPLRSNTDNTIFDEITNNKLIRRIASDGSILENPIESKINPIKIKMFNSNTEVMLTNTVKPELSFNYPGTALGILDKHDEDIQAINNKIKESFQYVSSGKELLETTIIDKQGTVSKEGQFPTFEELNEGIKSIPSQSLPFVTYFGIEKPTDVEEGALWFPQLEEEDVNNIVFSAYDVTKQRDRTIIGKISLEDLERYPLVNINNALNCRMFNFKYADNRKSTIVEGYVYNNNEWIRVYNLPPFKSASISLKATVDFSEANIKVAAAFNNPNVGNLKENFDIALKTIVDYE